MHIDSRCKRYLADGGPSAPSAALLNHAITSDSKSKQKQQWSKFFSGGAGGPPKSKDKGKGKSR